MTDGVQDGTVLTGKRLGIVSDCVHYRTDDGSLWALTPVVKQFEQWARLAESVTVCAPMQGGPPPRGTTAYKVTNVSLLPVREAGGNTIAAKLRLLRIVPEWVRGVRQLVASTDALHLRAPNNIGIVALLCSRTHPAHVQAVYTGNWAGYAGEPSTYRFQRWFLARKFRGPVFAYPSANRDGGTRLVETFSPVVTDAEWELAQLAWTSATRSGWAMTSVGALNENKGQATCIRILAALRERGCPATLDLIGAGPSRDALHRLAAELDVSEFVDFRGGLPHAEVCDALAQSDFFLLPSKTEGFSKAILEALTYGAIPVVTDLPANRLLTGNGMHGQVIAPGDVESAAAYIESLGRDPVQRRNAAARCATASRQYTLDAWRNHLARELSRFWREV